VPPLAQTFWMTVFKIVSVSALWVPSVRATVGTPDVYVEFAPVAPRSVFVLIHTGSEASFRAVVSLPAAPAWLSRKIVSMSRFSSAERFASW
jgi:hypothetical protein